MVDEKPSETKQVEKRQRAVAIQYDSNDRAPRVVATGAGEVARRILQLAADHDVPVKKDNTLTQLLSNLDLNQEIPEEAYRAVAAILAFLYRSDESWKAKNIKKP